MLNNMIMKSSRYSLLAILAASLLNTVSAREIIGLKTVKRTSSRLAGCSPAEAKTDLDINNVRTTILVGGDMWWDKTNPKYEVPKVTNVAAKRHSLFAGSLWIGGIDDNNNLRVAAQTYRQTGNDFFAGPLDTTNASTNDTVCKMFDRHWKFNQIDIENFANGGGGLTKDMQTYPGNGDLSFGHSKYLAPFYDKDGDGLYSPQSGDFPFFKVNDKKIDPLHPKNGLKGDQSLWWVFNDAGNIHGESSGTPIGMEIQAQAFAFSGSADNPLSYCTFYQYTIINRGNQRLNSTYFGQWVDPDLGKYDDDYVGCDVSRGLGYCYNGDEDDDGPRGYGLNPPAVGVDFFEGPIADKNDGIDNDRDGSIDEAGEQIIMSKFVYYNNDATPQGNPSTTQHFYDYLNGIWKDRTPITYGGNGKGGGQGATTIACDFMFPGDSDPKFYGTKGTSVPSWTEVSAGNLPADRRFIQSAGPFTLEPGAVNYITTGVVWSRASAGGRLASLNALKLADDAAQGLFNSNFVNLRGPDNPDVSIRALDREVILNLSNDNPRSNNYLEQYKERDSYVDNSTDTMYSFQGYIILQLKNPTSTNFINEITKEIDPTKAKVVAQCDIKDDISTLINHYYDPGKRTYTSASCVPVSEIKENDYFNKGIQHSFRVNKDLFATGSDQSLINNKTYYYTIVAYGVNRQEITNDPYVAPIDGIGKPYIAGEKSANGTNIPVYAVTPHVPGPENGGQVLNSKYGDLLPVSRVYGQGNGGNVVDLTDASIENILKGADSIVDYKLNASPVSIKITDPVKVVNGNFTLTFNTKTPGVITDSTTWRLTSDIPGATPVSSEQILSANEEKVTKWGFSVSVRKVLGSLGSAGDAANGFISATQTFSPDSNNVWFRSVADFDGVRGQKIGNIVVADWLKQDAAIDPKDDLGKILATNIQFSAAGGSLPSNGTWAPYVLASGDTVFPGANNVVLSATDKKNAIQNLSSVLLVFTPDTSKWTRSPVIEESIFVNGVPKLSLRNHFSINKLGGNDGTGTGMGWFPGYAIDLETGSRLNIIYGEDSYVSYNDANVGQDMRWNPDDVALAVVDSATGKTERVFGGKHYIYIMGANASLGFPTYDEGAVLRAKLAANDKRNVFKTAMWVSMPVLSKGFSMKNGIPPSEARIKINMSRPYKGLRNNNAGTPLVSNVYKFSTKGFQAEKNNLSAAQKALDLIRVVPNPYRAASDYEESQFENKVKITNLPSICTINIYTPDGTLVRTITKDVKNSADNLGDSSEGIATTNRNRAFDSAIDWDLKNSRSIPIASGPYIIHVKADGVGEKVIKFFAVMRPLDLSNY